MRDARKTLRLLHVVGFICVFTALGGAFWSYTNLEEGADRATPRLDGKPGPLLAAMRFPSSDFPTMSSVEQSQLGELIPIDQPIRIGSVPAWVTYPQDPALGAGEMRRNAALVEALRILATLGELRGESQLDTPLGERRELNTAKERLAAALVSASPASRWLAFYNRGVVYRWQGNRQKAATDFQQAFKDLRPRLTASASEEVMSAGIHVLYGLGESLIRDGTDGQPPLVPREAVDRLRDAVVWSATLVKSGRRQGIGHAAEFFDLVPTELSTAVIRNDLTAAYLGAPDYSYSGCTTTFTLNVCDQTRFSGPCKYRNETFCRTRDKASNELSMLYDSELENFAENQQKESTLWALQNVAELESENQLEQQPEISYNVAHLLLRLKRPKLAYAYIARVTERGDQTRINEAMERLAFVTSILAGAKPTAISSTQNKPAGVPSEFRIAYNALYESKQEPAPFEPLRLDDERKAKSLDAWLFIRRFRRLLEQGNVDGFMEEYNRLMQRDVPKDFLVQWKNHVVLESLKRIATTRKEAQPETAALIDRYIARPDLFSNAELTAAGMSRPFSWWRLRAIVYVVIGAIVAGILAAYIWLVIAYRETFVSAYQRDRALS